MNGNNATPHNFKRDYEQLELDDRADWNQARAHYRRLVHLWHPDKYTQRPREKNHAQQQFISLTKSYDTLRAFHRQHGRLPFEPMATASDNSTSPRSASQKSKQSHRYNANTESDADALAEGILGRANRVTAASNVNEDKGSKAVWVLLGLTLLLGTIVTFAILDKNASERIMEEGREAIREAPPSEFMPSAAEIRKSEARGAFIQPPK
jgi:DnaJ-class molecular chaperone